MKLKLVRDKIPSIIKENGNECNYHIASYSEYKARLYEKMREELDEFINAPCYEEAADLYEVFMSILRVHEMDLAEVVFKAVAKKETMGGFAQKIILEIVDEEG